MSSTFSKLPARASNYTSQTKSTNIWQGTRNSGHLAKISLVTVGKCNIESIDSELEAGSDHSRFSSFKSSEVSGGRGVPLKVMAVDVSQCHLHLEGFTFTAHSKEIDATNSISKGSNLAVSPYSWHNWEELLSSESGKGNSKEVIVHLGNFTFGQNYSHWDP